ncbi:putative membrane protein [Synechococcus sp. A18-25c]|nr:putative membrane protein [Synechococcus sp. A15-60]QNJ19134.1 putative membrane protein [Synechococcus sp. A18-25c]
MELLIPFRFFGALLVGSSLLLMAQNRKELLLLGSTFLIGLGALEICLRVVGY